ncbi:MAG: alpha/beta hydrolase [Verrucomicrobiia bacterium]
MGDSEKARAVTDWRRQREGTLRAMQEVMGPLPHESRKVLPAVRVLEEVRAERYLRRKISFQTEANDRSGLCVVRAWVLIPHELKGRVPGMLCLHQTTYVGKDQTVGLSTLPHDTPDLRYAHELAERGYVTLSPDYPMFGELAPMAYARGYASETMKGVWNHMRATDVLALLTEVDPERLGVIGHSLGGHNALFVAAFDERLRATITSCGFTSLRKYRGGDLSPWSQDRYMPRVATVYSNDPAKIPFDFSDVLCALAPRLLLINAPLRDDNFDASGVDDCVAAAREAYRRFDAEPRLVVEHPDASHSFPEETRLRIFARLDEYFGLTNTQ